MPDRLSGNLTSSENEGINLLGVYRSLLRIVARLDESQYTESNSFMGQTEVVEDSDLANPARDITTAQD
jgi:hypothetical protein